MRFKLMGRGGWAPASCLSPLDPRRLAQEQTQRLLLSCLQTPELLIGCGEGGAPGTL